MHDELFTTITADALISEIPDYLNEITIRAFIEHLVETQDEIRIKIREAAKDDESEVARIFKAIYVEAYDEEAGEDEYWDDWIREYAKHKPEESSHIEFNLSAAAWLCSQCIYELRRGGVDDAFRYLGNAHFCLGMARGLYTGAEQTNLEKKMIYEAIAAVRHAENRSMKEDAIQYYKNNHKSYANKNDAALQIAEKIVPATFATVRDWLKGVNPE